MHENSSKSRRIKIGTRQFNLPQSRFLRIAIGILFVILGLLGFLPILGFWMIPLGLYILSQEFGWLRRARRRLSLWWARRRQAKHDSFTNKVK